MANEKEFKVDPSNMDNQMFNQVLMGAKALGITSEEVEEYMKEHKCSAAEALDACIARK